MIENYLPFWDKLKGINIDQDKIDQLIKSTEDKLINPIQGDYPKWLNAYNNLPSIDTINVDLDNNAITCSSGEVDSGDLCQPLQQLIPWRKGPFNIFDCEIDSEWQSFMKWNRIEEFIPQLKNKVVLDVGCGNGYYMFRMMKQKPHLLMGIDPGLLQIIQFWSVEKYINSGACVLPLPLENMPKSLKCFDIVFSMGVLYHRKSPIHHILELLDTLKSGGILVLETLIIDGDETTCLLPTGRYAQMRNVWFLPSVAMLTIMLQRNGFKNIQCIDVSTTTIIEQRTTDWMKFHSLEQFLNENQTKTIEGYPLPKRATLLAEKK